MRIKKIQKGRYKGYYLVPAVRIGRKYFNQKRVYLRSHAKDSLKQRILLKKAYQRKKR